MRVPAPRGAIYDARGSELAATADIDSVYADPQKVHDLGGTAEKLGRILDIEPAVIEARLSSPGHFVWIERHVTQEEARETREARLEGVHLTPEPRRFYPGRGLAGPVLGFADIDGRGLDGVELIMNERLSGRRVSAAALRDATGTLLMMPDGPVEPDPGEAVTLTIDRFVQYTAERALAAAIDRHKAKAGVIVVLDLPTGGVLAMANWPTYDPNRPAGARDRAARNRAITDVYEIGSIMKVFSIASALEAGTVAPDTVFDVNGGLIRVANHSIRDTYHDKALTVSGIVKRSSNVGAAKIAQMLGRDRLRAGLVRFGFGQKTGIELPGEEGGLLWPAKRWGPIELATVSFGMGLSVTPLASRRRVRRDRERRRVPDASRRARGARRARPGAGPPRGGRAQGALRAHGRAHGADAGVGLRSRQAQRHRARRRAARVPGRGQDRHRAQDRSGHRPLRRPSVPVQLRRLRARSTSRACWCWC